MTVIELLKIFLVSQIEKLGSSIDWGKFKEAFEEDAEKKLGTEFDVDKRLQVYNFIDEFAANFEAKGGFAYLGTDMLAEVIEDSLGTSLPKTCLCTGDRRLHKRRVSRRFCEPDVP